MARKKKLLQAAAGSAGGAGLDVDEVFSTYLYDGTGIAQTITNGIDITGEGGMTWIKRRSAISDHSIFDTERGYSPTASKILFPNKTDAELSIPSYVNATSSGFVLNHSGNDTNDSSSTYASWTFRKTPKFFDVVTFSTTTGSSTPITVNHNLGSVPGMIIVKTTSIAGDWFVFHRSLGSTKYLDLGSTDQAQTGGTSKWASAPTSTSFTLGGDFVQNATYVAYLFAHNNSDGEFGPSADQDVIKCGSYTGNASTTGPIINLGFEPQWLMIKRTDSADNWYMLDTMRGIVTSGGNDTYLYANSSTAELTVSEVLKVTATGFQLEDGFGGWNANGGNYIYMAIRRGPLAEPESATDVFGMQDYTGGGDGPVTGFVTDFALFKNTPESVVESFITQTRLTGQEYLLPSSTAAGGTLSNGAFDRMDGAGDTGLSGYNIWGWKRAPGYFDVVAYSGTGSARTVSHNLGAVPEMMWIKRRNTQRDWSVYHSALGATKYIILNSTGTPTTVSSWWNDTEPTSSVFTTGASVGVNGLNDTYIAYLFASSTVSKVGSYTGTGSDLTVDCGFSARFVLIKCTSSTGNWFLFDTERGITSTTSPRLTLDTTDAESSSGNVVNPDNSGFIARPNFGLVNTLNEEYIFYAIA